MNDAVLNVTQEWDKVFREVEEEEEPRNAVVIHSSHGLFVLSRLTGSGLCSVASRVAFLTDIPLPPHKV